MKTRIYIRNTFIIISLLVLHIQSSAQICFRETVWLQCNRDLFLAGEKISYNATVLEADTYNRSVLSNNVVVELVNDKGQKILRNKYSLSESSLTGDIVIPDKLATGSYYVRAYTNWMRNYGEESFAFFPVKVYNPLDINYDSLYIEKEKELHIDINPYVDPLSGEERCSVFTSDNSGKGKQARGFILSGPRDTVLLFNTGRDGYGTSYYHADNPELYQVMALDHDRKDIHFNLLSRDKSRDDETVKITERYSNMMVEINNPVSDSYKVLIHRYYSWSWFHSLPNEGNNIVFNISKSSLPTGISQITVLDGDNNIIAKQLWSDYNEESSEVEISFDPVKTDMKTRNSAEFSSPGYFSGKKKSKMFVLAELYLPHSRIHKYIPGLPGWRSSYEIPAGQDAFEGWLYASSYPDSVTRAFFRKTSDFPSDPEFPAKEHGSHFEHYPETMGAVLSGKITNQKTGDPFFDASIALTVLNDNSFYAEKTKSDGSFVFTFPESYNSRDYIMNYVDESSEDADLNIIPEYSPVTYLPGKSRTYFTREEISFLTKQSLRSQLIKIYSDTSTVIPQDNITDTLVKQDAFYGNPDFTVVVDRYVELSNLREIFFELVPYVNVRQHGRSYTIQMIIGEQYGSSYPTLVIFDGIPVFDLDEILMLPPDRIKSIDVKHVLYIHGTTIFAGIVNIHSVNGDFGGLDLPETIRISSMDMPEISVNRTITAKIPGDNNIPSLDNILLWGLLEGSKSGSFSFFTNDISDMHILTVYGFDDNGKWYRGWELFSYD